MTTPSEYDELVKRLAWHGLYTQKDVEQAAAAIERLQRELDELRLPPARIGGARIGPGVSFGYNDGFTEGEAHGRKQAEAALSVIKKEMGALQAHHNAATAQIDYMRDQLSTARASGAEEMRKRTLKKIKNLQRDQGIAGSPANDRARRVLGETIDLVRALPLPAPSPVPTQTVEPTLPPLFRDEQLSLGPHPLVGALERRPRIG